MSGSRSAPFSLCSERDVRRAAVVQKLIKSPQSRRGVQYTPSATPFPVTHPPSLSLHPVRAAVQRGGFSLFSSGVVSVRCIRSLFFVDPYVSVRAFPPSSHFACESTFSVFQTNSPCPLLPSLYFFSYNSAHFLSCLTLPSGIAADYFTVTDKSSLSK